MSIDQTIKLINTLKQDENGTILRKITEKTLSYSGFTFNVTRCFLNTYDPISFIKSSIIPIPKGTKATLTDSDKYRSIAISSILSKF